MGQDSAEQLEQWLDEGLALFNADQFGAACELFSRVLERVPLHVEALYYRAVAHGHRGQWDDAIDDFSAALTADPQDADIWAARGEAWEEKHEYARALIDFEAALERDPDNPDFIQRVQQLRQPHARR